MVAIQGVSITINSITAIDLLRSLHQGTSNKRRVAGPQQSPRPSSSDPLSTEGNNIVSDESGQQQRREARRSLHSLSCSQSGWSAVPEGTNCRDDGSSAISNQPLPALQPQAFTRHSTVYPSPQGKRGIDMVLQAQARPSSSVNCVRNITFHYMPSTSPIS